MARPNSQTRKVPTAKRSGPFVVKSDADVLGLRTLGALRDIKLDLLVLVEGLVAAGLDGGEVDEHVVASAVLRDEAETLVGVEPLDGSLSHDVFPCSLPGALCPAAAEDIHPCWCPANRNQDYEIQPATPCAARTACKTVPSTGPPYPTGSTSGIRGAHGG